MKSLLEIITWEPNVKMQYELLLMLLLFLLPAAALKSRKRLAALWAAVFCGFLLLHRAFLPFAVSGLYVYLLCGLLCMLYAGKPAAFLQPAVWASQQKSGAAGDQIGGRTERSLLFLTVVILVVLLIQLCRINIAVDYDSLRYGLRSPYVLLGGEGLSGFFKNPGLVNTVYTYSKGFELLTLPLCFFRSYAYVLCFNVWALCGVLLLCGKIARKLTGIAGAEVLTAFFCALIPGITNMAVTAKSDLLTLLCQLIFVYAVVCFIRESSSRATEENAPGSHVQEAAPRRYVGIGLAGLIASYALKPTSMIFSSALGAAALICLLWLRKTQPEHGKARAGVNGAGSERFGGDAGEQRNAEAGQNAAAKWKRTDVSFLLPTAASVRVLCAAGLFTAVCWIRTFFITGLPVTSVFSGVFTALGFSLNYPFGVQFVPDGSAAAGFSDGLRLFLTRLFQTLFCPTGADMEHVRMAWGGAAFVFLLLYFCLTARKAGRGIEAEAVQNRIHREELLAEDACTDTTLSVYRVLCALLAVMGVLSLLSLRFLYQIDGNYYMLLYALTGIMGTSALLFLDGFQKAAQSGRRRCGKRAEYDETAGRPDGGSREAASGNVGDGETAGRTAHAARRRRQFFHRMQFVLAENGTGFALLAAGMLYVTAFTGWAGAVGFTELSVSVSQNDISFGSLLYYDHVKAAEERHRAAGDFKIWQALGETENSAANHVIAFAQEPECYDLRCVAESYTDIAGSGGNVYLVKKLNIFKEYLDWSDTDFLYADKVWLAKPGNERAKELLEDLIEDGTLTDITYEDDLAEEPEREGKPAELTGHRYFYGRIDQDRVKEKWEVPLSAEASAKAEREMQKYAE